MEIEIPADTKTVTLALEKRCGLTLRSLLPYIKDEVELVVIDEFGVGVRSDADLYTLRASRGDSLLHKLARSRVVDGKTLLDLMPNMKLVSPETLRDTAFIRLLVKPPVPGKED